MPKKTEKLHDALKAADASSCLINEVIESGYYLRDWVDPFSGTTWQTVSDMMYGNKQHSSSFPVEQFIGYIQGTYAFSAAPPLQTYEAACMSDIQNILADTRRAHYISQGSLTFRGQPREYKFKRKIPSPFRADSDGYEVSLMPGVYRQSHSFYTFEKSLSEHRSLDWLLTKLEPNNPQVYLDSAYSVDIMRTEQHYATQTAGLDLAFELDTALFFATHRFKIDADGRAYYEKISRGEHSGVIYCFKFCDPPVKQTQYLIKDFELFKTYPPLRIVRQDCGLPLIGPHERNIALTDVDCVIRLTPNFELPDAFRKTPDYMFPPMADDAFYRKLLELKDQHPDLLQEVVEYKWARGKQPSNG